jgi:prevent-host-death family protein
METYGVEEARSSLGNLVEQVRVGGEHFVITRYGKPAAAIVPVEWLEAAKRDLAQTEKGSTDV